MSDHNYTDNDMVQDVVDFSEKFGLAYGGKPRGLPADLQGFRERFMLEELREYSTAAASLQYDLGNRKPDESRVVESLENQLDGLIDLMYVVVGTAILQYPPEVVREAWSRVHAANMQKVRVGATTSHLSVRKSSHDVVKPPGWQPQRFVDLVRDHAYEDVKPLRTTGVASTPKTTGVQSTRVPR